MVKVKGSSSLPPLFNTSKHFSSHTRKMNDGNHIIYPFIPHYHYTLHQPRPKPRILFKVVSENQNESSPLLFLNILTLDYGDPSRPATLSQLFCLHSELPRPVFEIIHPKTSGGRLQEDRFPAQDIGCSGIRKIEGGSRSCPQTNGPTLSVFAMMTLYF